MSYYTLVLGCDLSADGTALGPRTVGRLEVAILHYQLYPGRFKLVVASSRSPYHPNQEKTLGQMMAEYLRSKGCLEVTVLPAKEFNTCGEISAFIEFLWERDEENGFIVSASFHLKRVEVMLRRMYPQVMLPKHIRYLPVLDEQPTRKDKLLEPLKTAQIYLPQRWRVRAVKFIRTLTGNTSY